MTWIILQMNQLWPPAIIVPGLSIKCATAQAVETGVTDKQTLSITSQSAVSGADISLTETSQMCNMTTRRAK